MTAYNIVGSSTLVAGQPEDISQVLANLQAIQTILNGGIDNGNINAAAAILLSKVGQSGATPGQVPQWSGTAWVPATVSTPTIGAVSAKMPGNPAGIANVAFKMLGLNLALTPTSSGTVLATILGNFTGGGSGDGFTAKLMYGTGAAPGNGAAVTGTQIGSSITGADTYIGMIAGVVTGLSVATAYWFDVSIQSADGLRSATVTNATMTATEQ